MSAQTTRLDRPRVAVVLVTDRWALAEWEEARALDPEAMAYAEFVSAWALDEDEMVVAMAADANHFHDLIAEMGHEKWAAAALHEELNLEAREIIDRHASIFFDDGETYQIDTEAEKEPWPVYVPEIHEEDIPF